MKKILSATENFEYLLGKQIVFCYRDFHQEIDSGMEDIFYLELDADTYLFFSDGSKLCLYPNTEHFSLDIGEDSKIDNGDLIDISKKQFWNNKLNVPIRNVDLLFSSHRSNPYGLHFILENSIDFQIVYESEGEHDFDALIIR